ncbi:hypothetical protein GCM10020254_66730 [Streptomyces goshikiensis]
MHELAQRQREAYAKSLPKGRAKQFKELKIEAILDTPVNIVVTADPTRGGRHTLGRHTQPQMAPYSSALAVENLWLAARAEGLGVGWVSFFDEREMVRELGLPEHRRSSRTCASATSTSSRRSPSSRRPAGPSAARCPGSSTRRPTAAARCPARSRTTCSPRRSPASVPSTRRRWARRGSARSA